jgi:hypothetical protein
MKDIRIKIEVTSSKQQAGSGCADGPPSARSERLKRTVEAKAEANRPRNDGSGRASDSASGEAL